MFTPLRPLIGIATLMAVGVTALPALSAPKAGMPSTKKPPAGAVKAETRVANGTVCGKVKSTWVPGRRVTKPAGYFIPLAYDISVAQKKVKATKGKAKARASARVKALKAQRSRGMQACSGGNRGPTTPSFGGPPGYTQPVAEPPKFNLQGALALGLSTTAARAGVAEANRNRVSVANSAVNLVRINEAGGVSTAVAKGSPKVKTFLAAPNGKVYLHLDPYGYTSGGGAYVPPWQCFLAEVDVATGEPTCIEDTAYIQWDFGWWASQSNPAVQVDDVGALYYRAYVSGTPGQVVRRYFNGVKRDLTPQGVTINDFVAIPTGGIIASGSTGGGGASWLRRYSTAGLPKSIANNFWSLWLKKFPDGRIYFPSSNVFAANGIARYDPSTDAAQDYMSQNAGAIVNTGSLPMCSGGTLPPVCSGDATSMSRATILDGMVFMTNQQGTDNTSGTVTRVYPPSGPTPAKFPTAATEIRLMVAAGGKLGIVGTIGGRYGMSIMDGTNGNEVNIWPTEDMEIYSASYDGQGSIIFSGQRFSDAAIVVGKVNTSTYAVEYTGESKLEEVQVIRR